jgi:hypothetical protein
MIDIRAWPIQFSYASAMPPITKIKARPMYISDIAGLSFVSSEIYAPSMPIQCKNTRKKIAAFPTNF